MITLTAKIDLVNNSNGTLSGVSINPSGNNVSSEIGAILGVKKQGGNPFIIGASKIADGSTLSDKEDYFIGNQLSSENGEFVSPYTLTVNGNGITSLTIAFDTVNNRHPNTIKIDNVEYYDDDAIFTVNLASADTHEITIENWNTPNYPIVITGIYVDISIDINYRNLISLSRSIQDRSDFKLPSYGIISNTGSLEFNDLDGEIRDYAELGMLTSGLQVVIKINNTLYKTSEQIGVFQTETWDYDNYNRTVSVSLKDELEEWQNINVPALRYYQIIKNNIYAKPLRDIYNYLLNYTPAKFNMLPASKLDRTTINILQNTYIKYPLLEAGTLWESWQKLCEVCQCYIYKNNKNQTVFRYNRGA